VVGRELSGVDRNVDGGVKGMTARCLRGVFGLQNSFRENAVLFGMVRSHALAITETARYFAMFDEDHKPDAVRTVVLEPVAPNYIWMAFWVLSMAY
jgi:hypothetical protein